MKYDRAAGRAKAELIANKKKHETFREMQEGLEILRPLAMKRLFDSLNATQVHIVPGARNEASTIHESPDHRVRLAGAQEVFNRLIGRPRVSIEMTHKDGGTAPTKLVLEQLTDRELAALEVLKAAQARLSSPEALGGAPIANGDGSSGPSPSAPRTHVNANETQRVMLAGAVADALDLENEQSEFCGIDAVDAVGNCDLLVDNSSDFVIYSGQ